MSFNNKKSPYILFLLIWVFLSIVYYRWEFFTDSHPEDAINFFNISPIIDDNQNAAFALLSVYAPTENSDPFQWAVDRWNRKKQALNQSKYQLRPIRSKSQDRLDIFTPKGSKHFNCWLPGYDLIEDCVSKETILDLLHENKLMIDRYETALKFGFKDFLFGPFLTRDDINISKLFSIRMSIDSKKLDRSDLETIAHFLNFWRTAIQTAHIDISSFLQAAIILSYAQQLFYHVYQTNPSILDIYNSNFDGFALNQIDQNRLDQLFVGDFYDGDYLCLAKYFNFHRTFCQPIEEYDPFLKPGRTLQLIYQARYKLEECNKKPIAYPSHDRVHKINVLLASLRPGNFNGRITAFTHNNRYDKIRCSMISNYEQNSKWFQLFELFSELKRKQYSKDQVSQLYVNEKEVFRITNSEDYFYWNDKTGELVLDYNYSSSKNYSLKF